MPHEDEQFETLPPAIVDALREMDGPAVLPDAERDAGVLSGARRHLAPRPGRKQRNLRLFFAGTAGGALAAAAMVGVVVFLGDPFAKEQDPASAPLAMDERAEPTYGFNQPVLPGDINRSGAIDILDAYALAKEVEHGRPAPVRDLNNDGRVDQSDVDWIANRAVALNTGEQG